MSDLAAWNEILADENAEMKARIRELEERLHERDLAVAALSQQLADRDAAWERAIEAWWNKGRWASDSKDFLAAIRAQMEAEGGGA